VGTTKRSQKVKIILKKKIPKNIIFLSIFEALIHSMWTGDEKVMVNLNFSGNLNNFLKK